MIKDWISVWDVSLKNFPPEIMLAKIFTKPLQGSMFQKLQAEIQGIPGDTVYVDMC